MTPDEADATLFADALACEETRPVAFNAVVLDPAALQAACARAEAVLQSVALVEDSRAPEEADDRSPGSLALQRIEARLDLLTLLVARLARRDDDPPRALRWSALGARVVLGPAPEAGTSGLLRIQPCEWLPEALELPATILATDAAGTAWLRFDTPGPALTAALERHLFRVHRREIAGRRQRGRPQA